MDLIVTSDGILRVDDRQYICAIGRGGFRLDKHEGDRATPIGSYHLKRVYYRPDKGPAPTTKLPTKPINPRDGWCDDPVHPQYNTLVRLPFAGNHEKMWRDDALYDVVVEISHNDNPPIPGAGSAVFMHIAKPDYTPTEGCVALKHADLLEVLKDASPATKIVIKA
jgi:L,D-peptidoglycan transpeptidase YkuD (ErfK/YbiS/YcfS/YnhG family)